MKDMKWLKTRYIAHRGLFTKELPENSIEAFLNATKNGYDIELDIQLTKHNKLVVVHDHNLLRLCGVNMNVSDSLYKDFKEIQIQNTTSTIPLFVDVLDSLPKSTHLMIELKTCRRYKTLVSLFLKLINQYDFTYVAQSFDPRIVNRFKKIAPFLPRGFITKNQQVQSKIGNALINALPIHTWCKPDFYVYKFEDLPNKKMDALKAKGYPILSYTAKSAEDLQFVKERYDNAVFEGFLPIKN